MCEEVLNVLNELHKDVRDRLAELEDIPVTLWWDEPSPEEIERMTLRIESIVFDRIKVRLRDV